MPVRIRLLASVVLLVSLPVTPATITVNGTDETVLAGDTICTLPEAAINANGDTEATAGDCGAGSGADTIELTGDVTLNAPFGTYYSFDTGVPLVSSNVTISGNGFTIQRDPADPSFRIFAVATTGTLALHDVTVRYGQLGSSNFGAAVVNYGTVSIEDSLLIDNDGRYGGAVGNFGVLEVLGSTLADNSARYGGALYALGSSATTTIRNSTFTNNYSGRGGGGAIANTRGSTLDVIGSTFHGNYSVLAYGGALSNFEATATLTNTTLSANHAPRGGAVRGFRGTVTLTNTTLSGNYSTTLVGDDAGAVELRNSIVVATPGSANCGMNVVDLGNNFDDDGTCGAAAPIVSGTDIDAALADNGGPTQTHALFSGSMAQDAAGACGLVTDQRGAPRNDGACDSGAFELTGACCTNGPGTESECIMTTRGDCEANHSLYLGDGTSCEAVVDCVALLVTMQSMSAELTPNGVFVSWTTATEIGNIGFRLLRGSARSVEKNLDVVAEFIPGAGHDLTGATYAFLDGARRSPSQLIYYVEDIDIHGRVTRHGPIVVGGPGSRRARR